MVLVDLCDRNYNHLQNKKLPASLALGLKKTTIAYRASDEADKLEKIRQELSLVDSDTDLEGAPAAIFQLAKLWELNLKPQPFVTLFSSFKHIFTRTNFARCLSMI